jgi:hypothetical protein
MIRPVHLVGFCALLAAAPAQAQLSQVALAIGNTIVSTYPDGRTAELWLQPDGAYTAKGRSGDGSGGRWRVKDERLCFKQAHPFPAPFTFCTTIPQGGMDTVWWAKAVTGETVSVRVLKGR